MAENFSAFDYRSQEEVLTVMKHLTSVLSTAGMQLVEVLSPSHMLNQLHSDQPMAVDSAPTAVTGGPHYFRTAALLPNRVPKQHNLYLCPLCELL